MLKELVSVLLLYRANIQNLHWNAKGSKFDMYHKEITSDYYDMCLEKADEAAEFMCRLGQNPPNYQEVLDTIDNSQREYLVINSDTLYDDEEIVENIATMFSGILECIESCLAEEEIANNPKNVGIKSALESMHNDFDLQYRYINARRAQ